MLSFVSGLLNLYSGISNGLTQADVAKAQGRQLRREGRFKAANAEHRAADIMRTADLNFEIEIDRRKTARRNQTAAQSSARNRQAGSGFTSEGAGNKLENITRRSYDEVLENMSRAASIAYSNMFQTSLAARAQGRLQQHALNAEAQQYDIKARAIRKSVGISALSAMGAGILGYNEGVQRAEEYNTQNADKIANGDLTALDPTALGFMSGGMYAGDIFNNFLGFNAFTVGMTRKNNWRSFAAIAEGSAPGWQNSEFTL